MKLFKTLLGLVLVSYLLILETDAMSLADRGRKLMDFPGICMDCGYFVPNMHCDLTVPCTKDTCRKECIDDGPQVTGSRPTECDSQQNTDPDTYKCWWDSACAANERCCITDTGSYCSSLAVLF